MALVIGITGSMGCGKSFFTSLFNAQHFDVILSDDLSKQFLYDPIIKNQIIHYFGKSILNDQGNIDTKALGSIVFDDETKLGFLNQLLHPLVSDEIKNRILHTKKHVIIESALLFQSDLDKLCDFTICIESRLDIALERVKTRGTYLNSEKIKDIIKKQNESNGFYDHADIVISNNSNKMLLEKKFERLFNALKELKDEF